LALSRNKPVEFESQVLHMYFDRRHPKVMRVMDSTYAGTTCLSAMVAKGERDITGIKKRDGKRANWQALLA